MVERPSPTSGRSRRRSIRRTTTRQGAPAITFEGYRYLPQAKSLNSLVSFLAQRAARAAGVHEALLHHDGFLTEGASSNLFAVVDGGVLTPPAHRRCSPASPAISSSRSRQQTAFPCSEVPLPLADVSRWDECFITSTSRHVMPVTTVDGRPVGAGSVGPLTRRLMTLFETHFAGSVQKAATGTGGKLGCVLWVRISVPLWARLIAPRRSLWLMRFYTMGAGMELRQYVALLRKWIWLVILLAVIAAAASFVVSRHSTRIYQASVTLMVNQATNPRLRPGTRIS